MLPEKIFEPLSPPSSPRMSSQEYKPGWPTHQEHQSSFVQGYSHAPGAYQAPQEPVPNSHVLSVPQGASLKSYKTSPYPLGAQYSTGSAGPGAYAQHQILEVKPQGNALGGSIPGSPSSRQSQDIDPDDEIAEEYDLDASGEAEDGDDKPMTAAEIRNQKRKMKRFR
jgi:hypothetical protein